MVPAARTTTVDGRELRTRGLRTQARLCEAATKVFAEKGFHGTRVDDIVRGATTSHGTFYLYFGSKEALFEHLVAQVAAELHRLADSAPAVTRTDSSRAELREWVGGIAALYERCGPILTAWTDAELAGESVGNLGDDLIGSLASSLAARSSVPKQARLNAELAALALVTMTERVLYYTATGQVRAKTDDVVDLVCDVIIGALASP
jgi:AcrR family transcriptional regulator